MATTLIKSLFANFVLKDSRNVYGLEGFECWPILSFQTELKSEFEETADYFLNWKDPISIPQGPGTSMSKSIKGRIGHWQIKFSLSMKKIGSVSYYFIPPLQEDFFCWP